MCIATADVDCARWGEEDAITYILSRECGRRLSRLRRSVIVMCTTGAACCVLCTTHIIGVMTHGDGIVIQLKRGSGTKQKAVNNYRAGREMIISVWLMNGIGRPAAIPEP
jgi:hypothetical protein